MTRRWTNTPAASEIPYTPPEGCCFNPTDVQDAIDQLLHVGSLVAIEMDGDGVTSYCDLVKFNNAEISVGYLYKVTV
jgi:hypothetical protein